MTEAAGSALTVPVAATTERGLLEAYRREKLELADCLLSLVHLAETRKDDDRVHALRELASRLAEDRFQLAVVGQFSRGKSTLMNAILGDVYLPTGALPMTSVITTVVYGSEARATVRRRQGLPIETDIDDLERFVAQQSGEREELGVVSALVELPAEILRLGFCFVDTPGVGSAILSNTTTTVDFLPQADAVVFVTSVDSPITEAELSFLAEVRRQVHGRIFVVLNKTDLVASSEEQQAVAAFVQERLGEVGLTESRPFLLSAQAGLAARQARDARGFAASGVGAFEGALISYLTREKFREFLLAVTERCERYLATLKTESGLARRVATDETTREKLDAVLRTLGRSADAERLRVLQSLGTRARAILEDLEERVLPDWREDAARLLEPSFTLPGARRVVSRKMLRVAQANLETNGASLLDDSSDRVFDEWISAVERECKTDLAALSSLRSALESEVLRSLGSLDTPETRDLADPPRLSARQSKSIERRRLALHATSASRAQHLLAKEIQSQTLDRVAQLEATGRDALEHWLVALDDWSARMLGEGVKDLRGRFLTPPAASVAGELSLLATSLTAIRARIVEWSSQSLNGGETSVPQTLGSPENEVRGIGCEVCDALTTTLFQFMAHYQFELATQLERRATHAASNGFCPVHTWYYAEIGSPVGISASYARLGEEIAGALLDGARYDDPHELRVLLASMHPSREECPACCCLDQREAEAIGELRDRLFRVGQTSDVPPLCIDHAAALVDDAVSIETARAITLATAQRLLRRVEDMRTYALKRETLRRSLLNKEEMAAYRDVLLRLAGDPLLAGAPRRDSEYASPYRRRTRTSR